MKHKWNIKFLMKSGKEVNAIYETENSNSGDVCIEITSLINGNGTWLSMITGAKNEAVNIKLEEVECFYLTFN